MKLLDRVLNKKKKEAPVPPQPEIAPTFRPADIHDILPLSLMWAQMIQEIFPDFIQLDKEELDRFAYAMADRLRIEHVFTHVAEVGAKPVGFLHGYIQNRPYGQPDKIAFCECLYVEPEYRGKKLKDALVAAFVAWGEQKGTAIEFMTRYDPDLARIWERSGFKPYGIVFRR